MDPLSTMFFRNLASFGDRTAAVENGGASLTYRDLDRESDRIAARLRETRAKSLAFLPAHNDLGSLVGYLAVLKSGHAAALVHPKLDTQLLARLVENYQPVFFWQREGEGVEPDAVACEWRDYQLAVLQPETERPGIHPDLALLLSTSGTTGSPRFVRLKATNLQSNAASIAEYLELTPDERPITSLPMPYSYGLSVINSHLSVGATLLMTDDALVSRTFWDFLRQQRATSMAGVPYSYQMLKRLDLFGNDLHDLRTLTQAGGKLAPELVVYFAEGCRRKNIRFFVMYGQTEATARIAYLPWQKALVKPKSIGVPIPGGKLILIDDNGKQIQAAMREGELLYRGGNVMLGYAEGAADLAKGDEMRGELRTGDIGYFDNEGDFYITGRMKRFLKIFGNRVNLDEVERWLIAEGIECACGGRDDLLAVAVTDQRQAEPARDLIARRLALHFGAIRVVTVPNILKNPAGKVLYQEIFKDLENEDNRGTVQDQSIQPGG